MDLYSIMMTEEKVLFSTLASNIVKKNWGSVVNEAIESWYGIWRLKMAALIVYL